MYRQFFLVGLCGLLLPAQLTAQTLFSNSLSARPEVWHRPDSLVVFPQEDSISWTDEYTVFSVVRSLNDSTPECLWSFAENDTVSAAVLTKGIYSTTTGTLVSRNARDFSKWCVYAYHSGIHADKAKQRTFRLGAQQLYQDDAPTDSLSAMIEIEEIAYFGGNVSRLTYNGFQTYLALKYGVTLDYAPYISQSGDTLWHPKRDEVYYHRVAGIGNDTVCHWLGTLSQSKEDSLLYIQADSLLPNEYIIMGDDDGSLNWHREFDDEYALQRTWRLHRVTTQPMPISLALQLPALEEIADSLRLRISDLNGTVLESILPDSMVGDSAYLFIINRADTAMQFQFYGVNPHPVELTHKDLRGSRTAGNAEDSNIVLDANNKTIFIKGYPDNQVFTLYLYDSAGKLISSCFSMNPIDISKLPNQTVLHIEVVTDNQIVGSIKIPVNIK